MQKLFCYRSKKKNLKIESFNCIYNNFDDKLSDSQMVRRDFNFLSSLIFCWRMDN